MNFLNRSWILWNGYRKICKFRQSFKNENCKSIQFLSIHHEKKILFSLTKITNFTNPLKKISNFAKRSQKKSIEFPSKYCIKEHKFSNKKFCNRSQIFIQWSQKNTQFNPLESFRKFAVKLRKCFSSLNHPWWMCLFLHLNVVKHVF